MGILKALQGVVGQINAALKGKGSGATGGAAKDKGAASGLAKLKGIVGTVGKVTGVIGAVVGTTVAALSAIPLAVVGIVKASTAFVRALSPSAVERYEREQDNLRATIGFGLTPVIAYATKSVKEWAGILLPSIQRMKPIVDRISAAVSGASTGLARMAGNALDRFAAGMERILPSVEKLIETWGGLVEVTNATHEALIALGLSGRDNSDVFVWLVDQYRRAAVALTAFISKVLSAAGATDALRTFRASLEKAREDRLNPRSGLTAAANNPTVSGIEDVLKQLQSRAFVATTGDTVRKSETDLLDELIKTVQGVERSPTSWSQIITDGIKAAFPDPREIAKRAFSPDASTGGTTTIESVGESVLGTVLFGRSPFAPSVFGGS